MARPLRSGEEHQQPEAALAQTRSADISALPLKNLSTTERTARAFRGAGAPYCRILEVLPGFLRTRDGTARA